MICKHSILLSVLLWVCSTSLAQNSFQKVIPTDSLGFFGLKVKPDSSYLVGLQSSPTWKLLSFDKYGNANGAWMDTDSNSIYLQHMLALQDGGTLLLGMFDGVAVMIKLNHQNEVVWSRYRLDGFGFDNSFFFNAVQDVSGNIALLGNLQSYYCLVCISNEGEWLWSKHPLNVYTLSAIHAASDGGFYLTGSYEGGINLWKISAQGNVIRSSAIDLGLPFANCKDILELPGGQLMMLMQYSIGNITQSVLARLDENWNSVYSYKQNYYLGFLPEESILASNTGNFIVTGCVRNPVEIGGGYPGYQIFRCEYTPNGQLLSSYRYSGNYNITGVSQVAISPDQSTIICGYACDSLSYPFFPYIIKTDQNGITSCFVDTINITSEACPLNCITIDYPLPPATDSLISIDLHLQEISPQSAQTLCFTGLDENLKQDLVKIYPNPATDHVTLAFHSLSLYDTEVSILTMQGQRLRSYNFKKGNQSENISLTSLEPGFYLLHINIANESMLFKLLVIKP